MLLFCFLSSHIIDRRFGESDSNPGVPRYRGQDLFLPVTAIPETFLIVPMARSSRMTWSLWEMVLVR